MTGDGAVVRGGHVVAAKHAEHSVGRCLEQHRQPCDDDRCNDARAYLAQAAEIERLTRERDKAQIETVIEIGLREITAKRAEASEASTADLLKALERYGNHEVDCHSGAWYRQQIENKGKDFRCNCGLAAAKGETV